MSGDLTPMVECPSGVKTSDAEPETGHLPSSCGGAGAGGGGHRRSDLR
jgi:hypothetical protein